MVDAVPIYDMPVVHPPDMKFWGKVIRQFRSPENLAYLKTLFAGCRTDNVTKRWLLDTLEESSYSFANSRGWGSDAMQPTLTRRGGGRGPQPNLWSEVRRLNQAFYNERIAASRAFVEDNEPFHVQAFTADSLRPPGLEHLNGIERGGSVQNSVPLGDYTYEEGETPWSRGDANRPANQAMAEYWGEDMAASVAGPTLDGHAYGESSVRSDSGSSRYMNRDHIPVWQMGGRSGYDRDIDETLGDNRALQFEGQVRGWDMKSVRSDRNMCGGDCDMV